MSDIRFHTFLNFVFVRLGHKWNKNQIHYINMFAMDADENN